MTWPPRRRRTVALDRPLLALASLLTLAGCGGTEDAAESALLEGRTRPEATSANETSRAVQAERTVEGLDASSRGALAHAPFAVLLFPASYDTQVLSREGEPWVAVNAAADGIHLSLHGTDREHPVLGDDEVARLPTPTSFVRGAPAWITINEQIRSAAWHEGTVAWTLEVECDRPMDDPRCTEGDFVARLAEQLVLVDPRSLPNGGAR